MADDVTPQLDDAAIEALLGDVDAIDKDTDQPPADWKPPTWAEHRAMEEKLRKANSGAKNVRLKLASLQGKPGTPAAIPPKPGTPAAAAGDAKTEAQIRAEIEAEYKAKQDTAATQSAAVTALVAAGLKLPAEKRTAAAKRALGLLDLSTVTGADDTAGIEAAVDDARSNFPGLFDDAGDDGNGNGRKVPVKSHQRRLGGPGAASTGKNDAGNAVPAVEQLAAKIFGTVGKG
jgi:hypothetical protein